MKKIEFWYSIGSTYTYLSTQRLTEIANKKNIEFVSGFKGKKVLENFVNSKKYDLAFRLYPTNISQVLSFAEKKRYMPQKSTWFHPKPLDGLISSRIIF